MKRLARKFVPRLDSLERKLALSAGISAHRSNWLDGYLVYRITNPNRYNNHLVFPMGHVLVQAPQPVPGEVYNILSLPVRNGTSKTFTAASGFQVKFTGQGRATPILTGNEVWKPGTWINFYILTKKYYPPPNAVTDGFIFDLGGARSVAIPGPSAIFQGIKYNPATINRQLDVILGGGQGSQGGAGIVFGLPVTNIYEFLSAKTHRSDFGGYF